MYALCLRVCVCVCVCVYSVLPQDGGGTVAHQRVGVVTLRMTGGRDFPSISPALPQFLVVAGCIHPVVVGSGDHAHEPSSDDRRPPARDE